MKGDQADDATEDERYVRQDELKEKARHEEIDTDHHGWDW